MRRWFALVSVLVFLCGLCLATAAFAQPPTRAAAFDAFPATADTFVDSCNFSTNLDATGVLVVGHDSGQSQCDDQSLIQFDLANLPAGSAVTEATLRLYQNSSYEGGGSQEMNIAHAAAGWDETKVTWDTCPSALEPELVASVGISSGWRQFDVTDLVKAWVENGQPNHGFLLSPRSTGVWNRSFQARSAAQGLGPQLVVTHSLATPSLTPTATTASATPTASATSRPCPDNYEPNDGFDTAPFLLPSTEYWAAICTAQDVDYYGVTVGGGQRIRAELWSLPADFDLELYAPDRTLVGSSVNAGTTSEVIELDAATDGPYYMRVYGKSGVFDPDDVYRFKVTLTGATRTPTPTATPTSTPVVCPDAYEPNESLPYAFHLLPGTWQPYICCRVGAVDNDFFRVVLQVGDRLQVWLKQLPANYDLCVYDANHTMVGCSQNAGNADEYVEATAQWSGNCYLYVYGVQGACSSSTPYMLEIDVLTTGPSPTATRSPSPSMTPSASLTTTSTKTPTPTGTQRPSATPSPSPTPTETPSAVPLPDLIITDLWVESGTAPAAPAGLVGAESAPRVCYQILNAGQGAAAAGHRTRLQVNGQTQAEDTVGVELQPGQRLNRCFDLAWQCAGTRATLRVYADYLASVPEADDGNNTREETQPCDTTAPIILSGPTLPARNDTSVQVCWDTDEASNSVLRFDTQAGRFGSTVQNPSRLTRHCLTLINLTPATTYQYYVESCDAAGNCVRSRSTTFQTRARSDGLKPSVGLNLPATLSGKARIGASASDDQGVERVEFWMDDKLAHTDASFPFEWECETRGLLEGLHVFRVRAYDAFGNWSETTGSSTVRNHFDELTSPVHARITNLSNGAGVYGSVPIEVEVTHELIATIRSLEFEVDGVSIFALDYPPCEAILGGPWGIHVELPCGATPLHESAAWNAAGLPSDSAHVIEVHASDWDDNWGHASVRVTIDPPDPLLSVTRDVVRDRNRFQVTLVIRNVGTGDISDLTLADLHWGFQAVNEASQSTNGTVFGMPTPCEVSYDPLSRTSTLHFVRHSLPEGSGLWLRYFVVPILQHPDEEVLWPTIGDRLTLTYNAWGRSYSSEPRTRFATSSGFDNACAEADYLLITNPTRLFATGVLSDVNALLGTMAKLAAAKLGVLGYLPSDPASCTYSRVKDLIVPGGAWAGRLHANFDAPHPVDRKAYLLIVGEIEIVASCIYDVSRLNITWTGGTRTDLVERSDNYYADTVGDDSAPDLVVGRITGNSAAQLAQPLWASLEVLSGRGFDLSSATTLGGYEDGSGDIFYADAEDGALDLGRRGVATTVIQWSNWAETSWGINVNNYDGFALGDVDGDGLDEAIIARDETGRVDWYQPETGAYGGGFASAFTRYDGLACGDVDADGQDEIVVAQNSGSTGGRIYVYEADGALIDSLDVSFHDWDCLALGDALGDGWAGGEFINDAGRDEIVTVQESTDRVAFFRLTPSRQLHPSYDPEFTTDVNFTRHDSFAIGDVRADWPKDELVIIRNDDEAIYVYNAAGSRLAMLSGDITGDDQKDVRYTRYDGLALGDVDGDGEDEMFVICDEDEKIYSLAWSAAEGVWKPARRYSRLLDTWFHGIRYTGSETRHDGFAIGTLVAGKGPRLGVLRNRDGPTSTFYVLGPTWGELDRLANERFGLVSGNDSIVGVSGHGNALGASPIGYDWAWLWGTFTQHPFAFSMSCLTGDYDDWGCGDNSFSEVLFDHGAAAFIGSTEVSAIRHNHETFQRYFSDDWDPRSQLAGPRWAYYERRRADDGDRWRFFVLEYNYYGDPKFGASSIPVSDAAPAGQPGPSSAQAPPPTLLTLSLPAYSVEQVDGLDVVTIPDGEVLLEDDRPQVPIYSLTTAVPAGYQVQDVQMTSRGGLETTQGLSLPVFVPLTATWCLPLSWTGDAQPDGFFPTQDYAWNVVPCGDGSSELALTVYPFFYNPLTTDAWYYRDFSFQIGYITPAITITWLSADESVYRPGESVQVELGLDNPGPAQDIVVEATLRRYDTGEWVDGLLLRTLNGLSGPASFNPVWTWGAGSAVAGGEHYIQVVLRDASGGVLDEATRRICLGTVLGEVASLTATPGHFQPGAPVSIELMVRNSGDAALTGSAVIQVRDAGGTAVASFEHPFASLATGATQRFSDVWSSAGQAPGVYTVVGSVRWESSAATASVRVSSLAAARVYLPLITRRHLP